MTLLVQIFLWKIYKKTAQVMKKCMKCVCHLGENFDHFCK